MCPCKDQFQPGIPMGPDDPGGHQQRAQLIPSPFSPMEGQIPAWNPTGSTPLKLGIPLCPSHLGGQTYPVYSSPFPPRCILPVAPERIPQFHPGRRETFRLPDHGQPLHRQDGGLGPGQLLLLCHKPHRLHHHERLQQVLPPQPGCGGSVLLDYPKNANSYGKNLN